MVDVNGVGYELRIAHVNFLPSACRGEQVTLFTHLAIRDDANVLYGFSTNRAHLFRTLLRISGVGAKMGLAILSGMSAEEFARCVQGDDTAALMRLPGIERRPRSDW